MQCIGLVLSHPSVWGIEMGSIPFVSSYVHDKLSELVALGL